MMTSMAFWFSVLVSPKDLTLKEQIFRARLPLMDRRSSKAARDGDILALLPDSGLGERTAVCGARAKSHFLRPPPQAG